MSDFEAAARQIMDSETPQIQKRLMAAEIKMIDAIRKFALANLRLTAAHSAVNGAPEAVWQAAQDYRNAEAESNQAIRDFMDAVVASEQS